MSSLSIIAAPSSAPQVPRTQAIQPTAPTLNWREARLLEVLLENGQLPVWTLLSAVADAELPASRAEARWLRMELWPHLRRLIRMGYVHQVGRNTVSVLPGAPIPRSARRNPANRALLTVIGSAPIQAGSAPLPSVPNVPASAQHQVQVELHKPEIGAGVGKLSTKSASPTPFQDITAAGRALAGMRYTKRRWTGWLHGQHCWRGRQIVLSNGKFVYLYGVLRGRVLWFTTWPAEINFELAGWGVLPAKQVLNAKNQAAQLLGGMKRGVKERSSILKQNAARTNGRLGGRPSTRAAH